MPSHIAQQNQPPAARPTALLLSRPRFLLLFQTLTDTEFPRQDRVACRLVLARLVPERGLSLCFQPFQRYVDQIELEIVHRKLPVVVEEPRVLLGGEVRDQTFRV